MFKYLFFGLILILFNISCFYDSNTDYRNNLNKVPKVLTEHFPQNLRDDKNFSLIMNLDTSSQCLSFFLFDFSAEDTSCMEKVEKNKSFLQKFSAVDSNLIVVKRQTTLYWNPEKFRDFSTAPLGNRNLPIPYFESIKNPSNKFTNNLFSSTSESGLEKGFTFYVLDYKPGKFWEGLKDLDYMPVGAKNGYSRGLAFNRESKVIVYWFIVW